MPATMHMTSVTFSDDFGLLINRLETINKCFSRGTVEEILSMLVINILELLLSLCILSCACRGKARMLTMV